MEKVNLSESGVKYAQVDMVDFDERGQQGMDIIIGSIIMDNGMFWPEAFVLIDGLRTHKALIDGLESCGLLVDYWDVLSAVWTLILTF